MPAQQYRREYEAKIDLIEGERAVIATVNTDKVDRLKTVIVPGGARLDNYRKNPVVLAHHNGQTFPIGKNQWIKKYPDRLVAKTVFLPEGIDENADKIFRLYQLEFLRAWSVSFDPIAWGKPTSEELRNRPDWAGADIIFRQWDLLEYSAVTVPGNADAITEACSRGLGLSGWPELPQRSVPTPTPAPPPELPPLVGRTLHQVAEAMKRRVRAEARGDFERALNDARELARGMV